MKAPFLREERNTSDGDRIVGVAGHVPAGVIAALREKRMAAGHIFFRMNLVQFKGGFVTFIGNRQEANAMNRAARGTEFGRVKAEFVPREIDQVSDRKQRKEKKNRAGPTKTRTGREIGRSGHCREDLGELCLRRVDNSNRLRGNPQKSER